jgi:hypothetical protein
MYQYVVHMSYYTSSARKETIQWTSTSDTVPRIGDENYKAVDRCVGPADLFSTALDLPRGIVDGAWAERKPELVGTLQEHGASPLVGTHGWRFRHEAAFDVGKLTAASWAPSSPLLPGDRTASAAFVQASLRAQGHLRAGAYLVPGWLPATPLPALHQAAGPSHRRCARPALGRLPGQVSGHPRTDRWTSYTLVVCILAAQRP